MHKRLYLLKISLLEIEPVIWRRFVVPASITLDRLHDVIQIVMGWTDTHIHEFTIGKKRYTEFPESKEDGLGDGRYRLFDLVGYPEHSAGFDNVATIWSRHAPWSQTHQIEQDQVTCQAQLI